MASHIAELSKRGIVPPIDPQMLEVAERNKLYIYNVSPREFRTYQGSLGHYTIPACPEGSEVSAPLVIKGLIPETNVDTVDGTDVRYKWTFTNGKDLALNIVGTGPFKDKSEDLTRYGVFIAAGDYPTPAEIERAHERLNEQYSSLVRDADQAFEVNGGQETINGKTNSNITLQHVQAARALGLDRPWARKNVKQTVCDECGTGNMPTAAKCKECGVVLNEEAWKRKFPEEWAERQKLLAATEEPKRGPGRPPKVTEA
jgi:hypothetical protein